jgi:hypothetical protein
VPELWRSTELRVTFSLVAMTAASGCPCFACKQMMRIISLHFCDKTAFCVVTSKSVQPTIRYTQLFGTKTEFDGLIASSRSLEFWELSTRLCRIMLHLSYKLSWTSQCNKWHYIMKTACWKRSRIGSCANRLHSINEHLNITVFLSDHHVTKF